MVLTILLSMVLAQHAQHDKHAMDRRGNIAMGFDQSKITHTFTPSDTGGEILIKARDAGDAPTIAQIRSHVKEIEKAFAEGDFSKPFFIHDEKVPGADDLKAEKDALEYRAHALSDGSRLVIVAKNPKAKDALHAFLRYQGKEHKR
jgi:hypothetical protein